MTANVGVLIVEKNATLKPLCVKSYNESELYKRCGFKSNTNFHKRCEWSINKDNAIYTVSLYGKDAGRIALENTYIFSQPLKNIRLFGNCVLVLHVRHESNPDVSMIQSLDIDLWTTIISANDANTPDYYTASDAGANDITENIVPTVKILKNDPSDSCFDNEMHINPSESDNDSNISELVEEEYLIE
mgnify:CR=1 FL=1